VFEKIDADQVDPPV